jgi:TetR/AcrR family transcriptional regulator, transcriptional repressor for nem operon
MDLETHPGSEPGVDGGSECKTPVAQAPRSHVARGTERRRTRDRLLRAGVDAVLEVGWAGTGVERVLTAVGVPKGSFYHYFASKEQFGLALLEHYNASMLRRLERCFGGSGPKVGRTLTHQLAAFLSESLHSMRRHRWRRGCLIGALGQELGGLNEEFRARLEATMREWEGVFAMAVRHAQRRGELRPDMDALRMARCFWQIWEGAVLRARLARSGAPLSLAIEEFDQFIHREGEFHDVSGTGPNERARVPGNAPQR